MLRLFGSERTSLSQADAAKELELPRATVRRAILTLHKLGYLDLEGSRYKISAKVLEFASTLLDSHPSTTVLQELCDELCKRWEAPCGVSIPDRTDAVMIARTTPNHFATIDRGVGLRIPLEASASGRVLLAYDVTPLDESVRGEMNRPSTTDFEQIKAQGFEYASEEVQPGFHSVAVPVTRRDGVVIAALNLGTSTGHFSEEKMCTIIAKDLKSSVDNVQHQLL